MAASHAPVEMCEERGSSHFHTKSWSKRFTCPTCGATKRQNLNYLGRRAMVCEGTKSGPGVKPGLVEVSRWTWQGERIAGSSRFVAPAAATLYVDEGLFPSFAACEAFYGRQQP